MLEIYNYPKTFKLSKKKFVFALEKGLEKQLKLENISIIFVSLNEIQKLNSRYRDIDTPTDVLSFNYNTFDILGEVYVCLEYIEKHLDNIPTLEEVLRLIIHGVLHLYDYDHKKEFIDINQSNLENMFILQERILKDVLKEIKTL